MTSRITGYHAHIYFDEASEGDARLVREGIREKFETKLGRWHHKPVGPHLAWMYQVAWLSFQTSTSPSVISEPRS